MSSARAALQRNGPRINMQIGVPDALAAQLAASNQVPPPPHVGQGLVDTGASNTCIDVTVATALGLQVINEVGVQTPAGLTTQQVYGVKLTFPGHGGLVIPFLAVAGAQLGTQGICALIGRDFLVGKMLLYDGILNSFTISF